MLSSANKLERMEGGLIDIINVDDEEEHSENAPLKDSDNNIDNVRRESAIYVHTLNTVRKITLEPSENRAPHTIILYFYKENVPANQIKTFSDV